MSRSRRVLAALVGVAAAISLLTACDKPIPKVTVQSGRDSAIVNAQAYCFNTDVKTCHLSTSGSLPTLSAAAGSTILVDVPRRVADGHWQVSSATQQADGSFKNITADGTTSPVIHDNHSTRVQVPFGTGAYYLVVREQTSSWVARISIKS
jgi:hypothetical protein